MYQYQLSFQLAYVWLLVTIVTKDYYRKIDTTDRLEECIDSNYDRVKPVCSTVACLSLQALLVVLIDKLILSLSCKPYKTGQRPFLEYKLSQSC